jgi:hypothetical protein
MSGGGAVVAIVAAQHARRVRDVMDAFRLAGATAPERARTLSALGVTHDSEVAQLEGQGILVPGPGAGTWYLSEAAVVARRDRLPPKALRVVLAVLVGLLVVLLGVLLSRNAQ